MCAKNLKNQLLIAFKLLFLVKYLKLGVHNNSGFEVKINYKVFPKTIKYSNIYPTITSVMFSVLKYLLANDIISCGVIFRKFSM